MYSYNDIYDMIIFDCLFNCPYFYCETCISDMCNLCFWLSLDYILEGNY